MGDTRDRIPKPAPAVLPFQGSPQGFRHLLKPWAWTLYRPLGGREAAGPVRGRNNLSPRLQPWEKGAVRGSPGMGDTRDRIPKTGPVRGRSINGITASIAARRPPGLSPPRVGRHLQRPRPCLAASARRRSAEPFASSIVGRAEKCGLDVMQPERLIKSSLAPLASRPPWIGKVQCN